MAGQHRAKKTGRQAAAYLWLGTGAITLGLGAALTGGSGVAQADTAGSSGSPGTTTTIRTTLSAQSVQTSTHSPSSAAGAERATSVVTSKDSVVRQMNPPATGDNDPVEDPSLTSTLLGLDSEVPGLSTGIPGLDAAPSIPFIEFGSGGGGLLAKIAGALSGGPF
jgi:hypothetical protein